MTTEELHDDCWVSRDAGIGRWPNFKRCLVDWRQSLRRQAKMIL